MITDILKEFVTFTRLKKIIPILILLFGLNFTSFAQNKPGIQDDAAAKVIKFFPNPATSNINFELKQGYDKSYTLQLFNFMGKKVYELIPTSQRINLSLNGFYRGVYIFQLRDKTGKIIDSGRFQVIR
ncbi:MAG: T9SS type A sorting domain-containing protein [Ferruginibacter sp.]